MSARIRIFVCRVGVLPSVANGICARSSEVLPYGMTMAGSMLLANSSNDDIVPMRGCFFVIVWLKVIYLLILKRIRNFI